jgi:hypothetical protein
MGKVRCIESMDELPSSRGSMWSSTWPAPASWAALERAAQGGAAPQPRRIDGRVVDWIGRAEHKPFLFLSASAIGYYGIQAIGDRPR